MVGGPQENQFCRAAFELFYYSPQDKECKTFIWGGCGGNENKFDTKMECEAKCKLV